MSKAIYVYVCATKYGTKIGTTADVERRRKSLSRARVVKAWHRPDDARTVENTALKLMAAAPVVGHECFDVPEADAVAIVEKAIEMADAGTAWPTANSVRVAKAESDMRKVSDALNQACARFNVICEDYARRGYRFDVKTMQFVKV